MLAVMIVSTLAVCVSGGCFMCAILSSNRRCGLQASFPILLLIMLVEMYLAAERSLEEVFYESVMHYEALVSVRLDWLVLAGVVAGCLFAYWWMHVRRFSYLRLLAVGIAVLACYLVGFYFTLSSEIHISQLYLPVACRGFAYAVTECYVYGLSGRNYDVSALLQALSVFNMLHMVVGVCTGGSRLYRRSVLLHGGIIWRVTALLLIT